MVAYLTLIFLGVMLAGGAGYVYDVLSGRLNRYTEWKDLNGFQWSYAAAMFIGGLGFIGTIVIVVIARS